MMKMTKKEKSHYLVCRAGIKGCIAFQTEHQQKQNPPKKKNNKNYLEKSTKKIILFL